MALVTPFDTISSTTSSPVDRVFLNTLHLSATIGQDCWGRTRPQPIELSVILHLQTGFLTTSGNSDDVRDSVHYGHLAKIITQLIKDGSGGDEASQGFDSPHALIKAVAAEAFALADSSTTAVRIILCIPKQLQLARLFSVDALICNPTSGVGMGEDMWCLVVDDLIVPVIIGVNPPERLEKQRVVCRITFHGCSTSTLGYPHIVKQLVKEMETSSYLTLEKFVMEMIRTLCLSSEEFQAVSVRAQKPSALSFAQASGVEMTRSRSAFS